ncbi:MAG: RNA 2',3'-cyclic phosphodiesterase [Candidatus Diapherotrites archaeon]|nr:RNA 2',3'-cyclic phosphodiesterase [Candidatus Diapherotrites archaeon]
MRCFIALNLSNKAKKEINELNELIDEKKFRKVKEENFHITMRFLGEISEEKAFELSRKLNEIKFNEFEIELNEAGFFGLNVLWIASKEKEKLNELNEKLNELIGEDKRFHAHVTLARNRNAEKKEFKEAVEKLREKKFSIKSKINSIDLMESELTSKGSKYKKINLKN